MATTLLDQPKTDATDTHRAIDGAESKYLTFKLADEEYGVEILKVREINGAMDITAVPRMPAYLKGVVNSRGKVIPVVDLRLKFGLDEIEHTEQTCVIVVNVGREMGIIVDTVSEVLDIKGENIEPPPAMCGRVDTSFILGMGKVEEAVKILLDIDSVLATDELIDIASAAPRTTPWPTLAVADDHDRGQGLDGITWGLLVKANALVCVMIFLLSADLWTSR